MSKKRGSRGNGSSSCKCIKLTCSDENRLRRALDLSDTIGIKPCIDSIIGDIVERLERERASRVMSTGLGWRYGWPSCMSYECMGEDEYDPYEEVFDGLGGKSSRELRLLNKKLFKGKKGKKKKRAYYTDYEDDDYWENRHTMYRNGEWVDDIDDDYEEPSKVIKFYDDIDNELSVHEFSSLKEFNDFCDERGYEISATDYNNLVNWSVVHCCLDPISEEYDCHEIITDNSYGALYWSVSEDVTKRSESLSK